MNKTRRFSYIKLALSTVLALGAFQTSTSFAEDGMENQLGIGIGVYGKAKMQLLEVKSEGNQLFTYFPEQTVKSGETKAGDNSGNGYTTDTFNASTNTSDTNKSKLTIDNEFEAGVILGYEILSPSSEGGLVISAAINAGVSTGREYKMEFEGKKNVKLVAGDLASGLKDLPLKDSVSYTTAETGNSQTIKKELGATGGLSINAGYAINESMSLGITLGGGVNMHKYKLSGASKIESAPDGTNFKNIIESTVAENTSESVFSYQGNLGARVAFNVTPSFCLHVGGGLSIDTEAKVKFKTVKVTSKSDMSVHTVKAGLAGIIDEAQFNAKPEDARYYSAADSSKKHTLLKAGEKVVHNGTTITEKSIPEIEKTVPSVTNAYLTIGAQLTF